MPYATLPDRALLVLNGDDTLPFLQGLVSNDVLRLPENGIAYTALLTPQGKFLYDFFAVSKGTSVLLDCDKAGVDELQKRLLMYRLRSKVSIEAMQDAAVIAFWDVPDMKPTDGITVFRDPRVAELGWRAYGNEKQLQQWLGSAPAAPVEYDLHRLMLGVPEGGSDLVADKSFLLPFGFEDLHGVDFKKGCYVGQEVTARSKHLGQVRKFIYRVHSDSGSLPAAGTPVLSGDTQAGELRSSRGAYGLALMNVEEVQKAQGSDKGFFCNNLPVRVALPAWVKNVPGTKA